MSRLTKLKGTPEVVKLNDEVEVEIKPLNFKVFTSIMEIEKNDKAAGISALLYQSLRKALPVEEVNDAELKQEIEELDTGTIFTLMDVIQRVNGIDKVKIKPTKKLPEPM